MEAVLSELEELGEAVESAANLILTDGERLYGARWLGPEGREKREWYSLHFRVDGATGWISSQPILGPGWTPLEDRSGVALWLSDSGRVRAVSVVL